jgi:hypothetical protein
MSLFDVPPDEMGIDPEIANEELEALLAGHGRDKNLDLTRFVDDLSTAFPAHAPASAAHLAAIAHEAQLLADKGDPVARAASNAVAPPPQAPKRWRNTMKDRKARILVKIAAPIVALFALLGIMGSAGALPRTLQNLTSNAAGVVGLNLPSGEDEGNDATADDQGDQDEQGGDIKDATDEGDQGDDATDQGDQNDQGDSTSSDSSDRGDQNEGDSSDTSTGSSNEGDENDQGDSSGSSTGSDQGDQNDQGDSTGSGGGSSENDQGDGGSSQDDQGDSSGDSGSSGSGSSGSDDNQN